jgi:ABC-type molybdenum transport system ATPase subunit/photorepair protein PhrA
MKKPRINEYYLIVILSYRHLRQGHLKPFHGLHPRLLLIVVLIIHHPRIIIMDHRFEGKAGEGMERCHRLAEPSDMREQKAQEDLNTVFK